MATAASTGFHDLHRTQLWFTIAGMALTLLLAAMDQTIVGIAMPRVIASLNGFDRYPWVTTAYLLTSTVAVPIFAKLSDLYGRKWFYLAGVVVFIVASWLCGASGNLPLPLDGMNQLILFRGIQGVGGGIIMGLTFTIIGDLFPPAERGKLQGIFGSVFGLASVLGPGLGGWITDHLSWRWAFYVNAPLGVLASAVLYFTFPYFRPEGVRRIIDWPGLAALCCWIVPLLLALSRVSQSGWTSPSALAMLGAALVFLVVFLAIERRAPEPLMPLDMFRNRDISICCAAVFLLGMAMFSVFLYLPLFMQGVLGASAAESGSLFTPLMLSLIASSVVAGQVIGRTGKYKSIAIGAAAITAVSMGLLAQMGPGTTRGELIRNAVLAGIGLGALQPIYTLIVQNTAAPGQMGVATASTQFFRSIGGTIGVAVFGSILLGIYHRQFDAMVPKGTPASALAAFANPLQVFQVKPRLGAELLRTLLLGVKTGLASALHMIYLIGAAIMAAIVALNFFLREVPLRKRAPAAPKDPT